MVDISDIFDYFRLGGGEGGVPRRQEGGGGWFFLLKFQEGGGLAGEGGGGGAWRVSVGNLAGGGKSFLSKMSILCLF